MFSLSTILKSRAFHTAWVQTTTPFLLARCRCPSAFAMRNSASRFLALSSSSSKNENDVATPPPMANLYTEWTLQDDQLLWTAANEGKKSPTELAALLGRGIRGVQARLSKLQDVTSPAYGRLFSKENNNMDTTSTTSKQQKLIPVNEVLRRIEWDYMLDASEFSFLHYDRIEDNILESPMDAPNSSVAGKETILAKAIPEHRIIGIKYKERLVWDRPSKLDLVFGDDPGIYHIIETYDEWKNERDQVQAWNRQRQVLVADRMKQMLGLSVYAQLQTMSSEFRQNYVEEESSSEDPTPPVQAVDKYVYQVLELFRYTRRDPSNSLDPTIIPQSDVLALEDFSELVAVLPDAQLRSIILTQTSLVMDRLEGKKPNKAGQASKKIDPKSLFKEEDLIETFVRGSGPGGQKINKTSNRVILIHEPSQIKVECQDTRSLQQNRKIARKRLLEKLDEHWNGSQSKSSIKQAKAAQKKQKSKSKNRARLRQKQQENAEAHQEDGIDFY